MRTLTRWEPTSDMANAAKGFDRMFDELMGRGLRRVFTEASVRGSWTPAVDIKEEEQGFVIYADIPGVSPEDIEITMENGVLTIKGERSVEHTEGDDKSYKRVERVYGSFYRRFALPDSADAERISASGKNGVLEVIIPKKPVAQPRRIEVTC